MHPPEFWERRDLSARAVSAALSPIAWLYGASVAYRRDHTMGYRTKARIVCVGNVTAGGSGKTPVAIAVALVLLARGRRVTFLTRGYGGRLAGPVVVNTKEHNARDVGDEPLLLARIAPTIVARDRKAGARLADAQDGGVIIMDDGHQNFALAKDLSIVVVDTESGFGNGRVLPAGPLREPVRQGLARADAVIMSGQGTLSLPGYSGPLLRARIVPAMPAIGNCRALAFAGIGRPEKFFSTLKSLGVHLVACHAFADHHFYTRGEVSTLKAKAAEEHAILVTTEKDYVRLSGQDRVDILALPVRAIFDLPEELQRLLDRVAERMAVPT
ncbi:MAG TPA: tetraacyldisaccharide 4'-kinase [Rhizomicrobium sp.]